MFKRCVGILFLSILASPFSTVTQGYFVRQARQPDLYEPVHRLGESASRLMPVGYNFKPFTWYGRYAIGPPISIKPQPSDPWPQLVAASPLCYLNAIPMVRVPDLIVAAGVVVALRRARAGTTRRTIGNRLIVLGTMVCSMMLLASARVFWTGAAVGKQRTLDQAALTTGKVPALSDWLGEGSLCYLFLACAAAGTVVWLSSIWTMRAGPRDAMEEAARPAAGPGGKIRFKTMLLPVAIAALWLSPWLVTWTIAPIIALGFRYLA